MSNTKVNLTILLPGSTMMSERDCSKEVKRPVINKKGKYAGKQKRNKKGELVFETALVPDPEKCNHYSIKVSYKDDKTKKMVTEFLHFNTRGYKTAKQSLNISEEAYDYFIGNEVPDGYRFPKEFKPNKALLKKGISVSSQAWNSQSQKEKLEWHLRRICESRGGRLADYTVFND